MSASDSWAGARQGLTAGALFALAEILLAFGTGVLPRSDAAYAFPFAVVVWSTLGLGLDLVSSWIRRRSGPDCRPLVGLALLLGPPLLLLGRCSTLAVPSGPLVLGLLGVAAGCCYLAPRGVWTPVGFAGTSLLLHAPVLIAAVSSSERGREILGPLGGILAALGLLFGTIAFAQRRGWWAGRTAVAAIVALATLWAAGWATWRGFPTSPRMAPGPPASRSRAAAGPSIILITMDTVRADHVSAYGHARKTTPNVDKLAARGTLYENAYANSPYTLSSHASLFTGLLPSEHGARPVSFAEDATTPWADYPLNPDIPTLAEKLASRGYATAGFVANTGYLSEWTGLSRGFRWYECRPGRILAYGPIVIPATRRLYPRLFEKLTASYLWPAPAVTDAALDWLEKQGTGPFFLFLNYLDAHDPYEPRAPFDKLFTPDRRCPRLPLKRAREILRGRRVGTVGENTDLAVCYDAEIASVDAEIGRLLDSLGRARTDDLVLVVTSDHGEFFGEHGLYGHLRALYEPVLRVPLVIAWPGQQQGTRVAARLGLHQLPALLEAAADGRTPSVPEEVKGDGEPAILAEYWVQPYFNRMDPNRWSSPMLRAGYLGSHKVIQKLTGLDEFYDLARDPGESQGLAAPDAQAHRDHRKLAGLPPLVLKERSATPVLGDEAREQLRALGYIE